MATAPTMPFPASERLSSVPSPVTRTETGAAPLADTFMLAMSTVTMRATAPHRTPVQAHTDKIVTTGWSTFVDHVRRYRKAGFFFANVRWI